MWTKSTTVWFRNDFFYFIYFIDSIFYDMKLQTSNFIFIFGSKQYFCKKKKRRGKGQKLRREREFEIEIEI